MQRRFVWIVRPVVLVQAHRVDSAYLHDSAMQLSTNWTVWRLLLTRHLRRVSLLLALPKRASALDCRLR